MIAVDLYHTEDRKFLPNDGRDIDGCKIGKTFGIRVKFKPLVVSAEKIWKVWVTLDGKTLGYSHIVKPTDTQDGYYRTTFKGWRANDNCTEMMMLTFEVPAERGDGDFGSVHAFVSEGYYSGKKTQKRDVYVIEDKSGKAPSSSTLSDIGDLAAGTGECFESTGFWSDKKWVHSDIILDKRVFYGV